MGDEIAARVAIKLNLGHLVHYQQQSHTYHQYGLKADPQFMGKIRHSLFISQLDRKRAKCNKLLI